MDLLLPEVLRQVPPESGVPQFPVNPFVMNFNAASQPLPLHNLTPMRQVPPEPGVPQLPLTPVVLAPNALGQHLLPHNLAPVRTSAACITSGTSPQPVPSSLPHHRQLAGSVSPLPAPPAASPPQPRHAPASLTLHYYNILKAQDASSLMQMW